MGRFKQAESILKAVIYPKVSLLCLPVLPMNKLPVTHKQINMARSDNPIEISFKMLGIHCKCANRNHGRYSSVNAMAR